jgi:hypothetical protein
MMNRSRNDVREGWGREVADSPMVSPIPPTPHDSITPSFSFA